MAKSNRRPMVKTPTAKTTKTQPTKRRAATTQSTTPNPDKDPSSTRGLEDSMKWRGNPHKWPVVEILWVDAVADGLLEWLDPEDVETIQPVDSVVVGYLLKQTDTHTTVASLINDGSVAHILCIPNQIITETRHWTQT